MTRKIVPILLYHSVTSDTSRQPNKWVISRGLFAAHLAYLHEQGYVPITATQLALAMLECGDALPAKPVVISFDDGLADFYTDALPELMSYAFVATLYITTGFVGRANPWIRSSRWSYHPMLTWAQIDELSAAGIECGAHSHTHPNLDLLPPAQAYNEIFRSKAILEEHLGRSVTTFAYPHGYYNRRVRGLVEQAGYFSACAVKHALSATDDDRFALARVIISANTDVPCLDKLLAGQGLRVAPVGEHLLTKGWRLARRFTHFVHQQGDSHFRK